MTVRRVRPRLRPWFSGLACLLVIAAALGGAPAPAVAAPPYSLDERAVAIASPALVYVEMVFTGYVRDKQTKTALRTRPVTVNRRCSGFVVNPDGYVVTNGVCLQPGAEAVRQIALYSLGRTLIDEEQLDPKELDAFVEKNRDDTIYTGVDAADAPESRVFAQFNVATGNLTASPAVPGAIVETLEADQGNVALVKLQRGNLPAVELNPATDLRQGSDLVAIGFDSNDSGSGTDTYTPRWKSVKLSSLGTRGLVPVYRVNGDLGVTSRGGMLVDTSGRAVGMIDSDQARADRDNRAAIQSVTIAELLKDKGVANTLGETDRRYRGGLDAYFAGRYSSAISAFETVVEKSPDNQVARTYRQNALDRREIEGDAGGLPVWLAVLLGAAGGIAVSGLVAVAVIAVRRRGERRRQAAGFAPYPYAPVSAAPMSGAPMSGAPTSGYPQDWPAYQPPPPAQQGAPFDEHGLPAYPSGGQHFPLRTT
ncbi:MAG TPA: trypsin-like peptidase domain-containing protein, partial [Micromonosporaceae bacterium]|nr:trypsin-like peptidase domain-containing protein [Micromonosporaceae bacterium]